MKEKEIIARIRELVTEEVEDSKAIKLAGKLNTMLIDHEILVIKERGTKIDGVINSRGKLLQYVKSLIMKEIQDDVHSK